MSSHTYILEVTWTTNDIGDMGTVACNQLPYLIFFVENSHLKASSLEQFLLRRRYWLKGILCTNKCGCVLDACKIVFSAVGVQYRDVLIVPPDSILRVMSRYAMLLSLDSMVNLRW